MRNTDFLWIPLFLTGILGDMRLISGHKYILVVKVAMAITYFLTAIIIVIGAETSVNKNIGWRSWILFPASVLATMWGIEAMVQL